MLRRLTVGCMTTPESDPHLDKVLAEILAALDRKALAERRAKMVGLDAPVTTPDDPGELIT